jgi:uncharacterized protein
MSHLAMNPKLDHLRTILRANAPLMIAYSGGVDSACLLALARDTLGASRMLGVIADSPSLPRQALSDARTLAEEIGAPLEVIQTSELEDARYASNPLNRCYFCKSELFTQLDRLARERGFAAIAYGENADDAQHVRPGRQAAEELAILAPLKEAGLTKEEIRNISRDLSLPTAEAPAQPCLSSRIPHGTPVTTDALSMIEQGEAWVRSLGFRVFRVRYITASGVRPPATRRPVTARVQIAPEEMNRVERVKASIVSGLLAVGYESVEIDPAGYRSPA